jgi:hypothetical protein
MEVFAGSIPLADPQQNRPDKGCVQRADGTAPRNLGGGRNWTFDVRPVVERLIQALGQNPFSRQLQNL